MKRLAIIGSGDLGQQIAYHSQSSSHYEVVGFFDDFIPLDTNINGIPIIGRLNEVFDLFSQGLFDQLMLGIGYKHMKRRAEYFDLFSKSIPFATIIHDSSYVDKSSQVGEGSIIYPGCILDLNVKIGENVLLNAGCIIAHDTIVGKHSFLSPGVSCAGFVEVGESVNLGIGTIVIDNIKISNNCKTGAGSVVVDNLCKSGLYFGVPARFIKQL
jgi:sugar O-acyltransferase (sialic acid O-acetyltransferase NeuD family)